jgi:zinc protease
VSLRIAFTLLGLLAVAVSAARAATRQAGDVFPYKVHATTLDNGFQIDVVPYDSPGIVAFYLVVRTGARDEVEPGHSGFAHFFEHMMFRGTERYSTEAYNDVLKRMGADSNAMTTSDETIYHIVGPASELETMMDLESDRFKNLKYDEETFRTEALAVLGEYNKAVTNPVLPMLAKLQDLAFTKHTYKHLTIGFLDDIKAMPGYYEFSRQFFDRFYRPENVTLLVVGDVQTERVAALAKRYFGDWKKGYRPTTVPVEPPQKERKAGHLDWPNPVRPYLMIGYHIPAFSTATVDSAALDLISQLLFSDSAPLYQELVVEKQWVDLLQGSADNSRDPYLFTIIARAKSEDLVPKIEEAIDRHLALLQSQPLDAQRLDRIKSYLRHGFALSLDSPGAVADQAAAAIGLTGDVESINRRFAQYQKVTPADVQRLARQIFRRDNETVVTLTHPAKAAGAQAMGGASHE